MSDDDTVTVARARSEFEAQAKAAVLRDADIDAFVVRGAPSWTGHVSIHPTSAGASVLVRRRDLERARETLRRVQHDADAIDWASVDVGERVDQVPLRPVGRRPLLATVGLALGIALIVISAGLALVWAFLSAP